MRNIDAKHIIKLTITPILSCINKILPKNEKQILLYSANRGIEHNLIPLRKYLLDNGYDHDYKIICGIKSLKYRDNDTRVVFVNKLKAIMAFLLTKYVFYTTGQIPIKPSQNQMVIHLDHGMAFKSYGNQGAGLKQGSAFYFTLFSVTSPIYIPVIVEAFECKSSNICINGELEMDRMLSGTKKYNFGLYKKLLLWTPTFRQSDILGWSDSREELLPMFKESDYVELNERLKMHDYMLVVKLHSMQNVESYNVRHFSNLKIYTHDEFRKADLDLYYLMGQAYCLIADYSSVFLQFLLLDKPMMFAIPDFEEYAEKRGFVFEDPLNYMPGPHIFTKIEFYEWLESFSKGVDLFKEERKRIRDLMHTYQTGGNCKRILDVAGIKEPDDLLID